MVGRRMAIVVLRSQSWPYAHVKIEEMHPGEWKEVRIPMRGEA